MVETAARQEHEHLPEAEDEGGPADGEGGDQRKEPLAGVMAGRNDEAARPKANATTWPTNPGGSPLPLQPDRTVGPQGWKPREVTGWGVLLAAAVVAALLVTMMLWALEFMTSEFVTPVAHR
jgi:hypothetical protein